MKDYQIFKKITPLILKRVSFALAGLLLILAIIGVCTYWGELFPEYRTEIIIVFATLGVFAGWKIIRKGEAKYRLGQIAIITDCVLEKERSLKNSRMAMKKVKETFKYASVFALLKNIIRHKNLRKLGQYSMVMVANILPYSGICNIAYVFAHPDEERLHAVCHAISSYYANRKTLRKKIILALLVEIIMLIVFFIGISVLLLIAYALFKNRIDGFGGLATYIDDFSGSVDILMNLYFSKGQDYEWLPEDTIFIVALYIAWFLKVFTVRAYKTIGVVRTFLAESELNPPTDDLYNKLVEKWEKSSLNKKKNAETDLETSNKESK